MAFKGVTARFHRLLESFRMVVGAAVRESLLARTGKAGTVVQAVVVEASRMFTTRLLGALPLQIKGTTVETVCMTLAFQPQVLVVVVLIK